MDHVWEANASASPPAAPVSPSTGYPTETGSPTQPGAWWFHMMTEEIRNVILAGGLTPSYSVLSQLSSAIIAIARANSVSGSLMPVRVVDTVGVPLTGSQTVDGVVLLNGDRVLEAAGTAINNAIWIVNTSGAWARSTDMAGAAIFAEGVVVPVSEGTANANSIWSLNSVSGESITIGTTANAWTNITGSIQAQFSNYLPKVNNTVGLVETFGAPGGAMDRRYNDVTTLTGMTYNGSVINAEWMTLNNTSWSGTAFGGRDVIGPCLAEVMTDAGQKLFFYAVSAAAGVAPTWALMFGLDMVTGVLWNAVPFVGGASPITGNTRAFVATDRNQIVRRSNSGTAMTDTLPGTSPGVMAAGWSTTIINSDSSASISIAAGTGATIDGASSITLSPGQSVSLNSDGSNYWGEKGAIQIIPLYKIDSYSPVFVKTAAGTISVKAGTQATVAGVAVQFPTQTAVVMPTLTAGTDYAVYVCADGTIRADASFTNPTGYTTSNSRLIGGFHYGLVAPGTTLAGGSFATTGNGMIWVQSNVDDIAGINKYSLWDLKFRAACGNNAGMVLVNGRTWVDIYLCSTDTAANGTSKYNTNIASGTVLPKIPAAFGGNGTTTYPTLNWWVANELARANLKRLPWEHEFVDAAFGVTENQSIDATASTYPTTLRNAGYTSKYGIEEASGHHWIWGQDTGQYYDTTTWSYKDLNGNNGAGTGRGQIYTQGTYGLTRVILGGARTVGADSGSRCSSWNVYPWSSGWAYGLRAVCDHLIAV